MSNMNDFVIENDVLIKYVGPGGNVVIPDGIKEISDCAFKECCSLVSIELPESVTLIGSKAFYGCRNLKCITTSGSVENIGIDAFLGCAMDSVSIGEVMCYNRSVNEIPEGIKIIKQDALRNTSSKYRTISLPSTIRVIEKQGRGVVFITPPPGTFQTQDKLGGEELIKCLGKWNLKKRDWSYIYIFQSGKNFEEISSKRIIDDFNDYIEELVDILKNEGKEKHYRKVADLLIKYINVIDKEFVGKFCTLAESKGFEKIVSMFGIKSSVGEEAQENENVEALREIFNEYILDKAIAGAGKSSISLKARYADSNEKAPEFLVKCAIAPYLMQYAGRPKKIGGYRHDYMETSFVKGADYAAALLNSEDLRKIVKTGLESVKGINSAWLIPYGRYADGKHISGLISKMKEWENWYMYAATGRSDIITARGALLLSDTKEAIMKIDKDGCLEVYGKMRGKSAESIRDTVLSDFGMDVTGKKEYDLGNCRIEVTLEQDLSFRIFNVSEGKAVKSIPKKGADPSLYEIACADFSEMKKNAKKVAKSRIDLMFSEYLDRKGYLAKRWIECYTLNPLLRRLAEMVVWVQDGKSFIMKENQTVDCYGNPCVLTGEMIYLAHPMEMNQKEISDWQKYFTSNGLKQPFEQIWEPVIDRYGVKEDRYKGCKIPFYRFRGQAKRGITIEDIDFHNEIYINFEGCDVFCERIDWERHEIDNNHRFEITSFAFRKYTRRVNHIIAYLDRIAMYDRIERDDMSAVECFGNFTLAQINEFITIAMKNKSINCLSALMDWKNEHFAEYDPMDEFVL